MLERYFDTITPPVGDESAPQCEGWLFPNGGAKVEVFGKGVKKPIVG